ncbi:RAB6-interacting golgin-like isoform X1 [Lytechinus pictus]|uniref:RAB6-interacting golgin-like isoform X1 n=2 Tax=Lytechinus pictus TaxID=7653 RepID=UPI0030BA09C4
MAWTGFTDEQLNALKQTSNEGGMPARGGRGQHNQRGRGRSGVSRGRGRPGPSQAVSQTPVSPDQMLSRPKPQGTRGKPVSSAEHSVWSKLNEPTQRRPPPARRKAPPPPQDKAEDRQNDAPRGEVVDHRRLEDDSKKESLESQEEEAEKVKILDEEEGHEREISKLEEFQKKQKQMEEENTKKKNLLARAIADRKKKTQAEAKRLLYIQKELTKIESLLTNDVSILRDKIEEASRDFNDAQRRYQKAEAEFVAAKTHLHKASEMKEALTEHLCTIIHENELRKARKLEELVSKLEVENLDEFEIPDETPPTSPVPITVPHQQEVTNHPSKDNGTAHISSNNSGSMSNQLEQSIVSSGSSSDKLDSPAAPDITTLSKSAEQTDEKANEKADKHEEKIDNEIIVSTVSCDQGDKNTITKIEGDSSSDQPEAEQHVEISEDKT